MGNISDKINELELADHFDDLVQYANEQASPIEKALLYVNILDVFVPALGFVKSSDPGSEYYWRAVTHPSGEQANKRMRNQNCA